MKASNLFLFIFLIFLGKAGFAQVSLKKEIFYLLKDSTEREELQHQLKFYTSIDSLYNSNEFRPVFDKAMHLALLSYIENTESWGLNLKRYHYHFLDSLETQRDFSAKAKWELYACDAYLSLFNLVQNGVLLDENTRGENIHLKLSPFNPIEELYRLKEVKSLIHLEMLEPNFLAYQLFEEKLNTYFQNQNAFDEKLLLFKDSIGLGDRDSSVLLLRNKLYYLGDLKSNKRKHSDIFDHEIEQALKNFQQRHLLESSGVIDALTVQALNRPLKDIIAEMQLNLERWRWLPSYLGSYIAFANLAAFEMSLIKEDSLLLRQNIVCGKVNRKTPVFSETMVYIDINPTWTVPPTILQNDILPAIRRSSNYLSKVNMKVLDLSTGKYVSGAEINWARASSYKYIQGPGLSNSLGVVKFIFPNDYYIFFHDTPHKEHFPLKVRAYSSGCVRLEKPLEFASILLSYNKETYSRASIDSIVSSQKTTRILLDEQAQVYIHYLTQEIKDGFLYQYPDIYSYNGDLREAFNKALKNIN